MNQRMYQTVTYASFAVIMAFTAFLCITVQGNYAVNGNISWLLIGAERLLQGQTMVEHIYEPNPPLSLIIYIPHVIYSRLANLPLPIGSFHVTSIFVLLSVIASHQIIKRYSFLKKHEQLGFTACYTLAVTITTIMFYSEREHIMILATAPFMLAQFALMERISLPKWLGIPVFLIGALGFLIKPHYGLVPTIFLLSRVIKNKSFNPFKHPDFLALSTMTLLYLGIIFTFFYDYIQIIFPELLSLYVGSGQEYSVILQTSALQALLYTSIFMVELFQSNQNYARGRFIRFLYICAILNLIPYYLPMKGFFNHLIPANSFFIMAVCASIMLRITPFMAQKLKWKKTYVSTLAIVVPFLCVLSLSNALTPLNDDFPTHKDMRKLPVARYLEENCEQPCSFFSFHTDIEIMPSTATIMGYEHASRFGSLWPLIGLLENLQSDDTEIRADALQTKKRYSRYILEDLEYYEPSLLIITKDILTSVNNTTINFMELFGAYEPLHNYIDTHYTKSDEFEYDRGVYFKGTSLEDPYTLYYDIYTKKNPQ